jgi:hypothetical protein
MEELLLIMDHHAARPTSLACLVAWTSLVAAVIGAILFGSIVAGVGEWVEGRELQTVAGWAIPALVLAVVCCLAAARALIVGRGSQVAAVLAVLVALTVLSMLLINPSIAPPVP